MHKLYSILGLCTKAGKLASGEVACEQAIRSKTAFVVLVAKDASNNTKKKFKDAGNFYQIPVYFFGTKETLGTAMGKEARAVIAVTEQGFAKKIQMFLEQLECPNETKA